MLQRIVGNKENLFMLFFAIIIIHLFSIPLLSQDEKANNSFPDNLIVKYANCTVFPSVESSVIGDKLRFSVRFQGEKNQTVFAVFFIKKQEKSLCSMLVSITLNDSGESTLDFQWVGRDYLGNIVEGGGFGLVLYYFNSPLLYQELLDIKPVLIPSKAQEILHKYASRLQEGEVLKKWEGQTGVARTMLAANEKVAINSQPTNAVNAYATGNTSGEAIKYTYTIDGADNITSITEQSKDRTKTTNITVNNRNQVTKLGKRSIGYDGSGNVASIQNQGAGSNAIYQYDALNRLVHAEDGKGMIADYVYDPLGRRLLKTVNRGGAVEKVRYVWDGWQVIEERDGSGNLTARYTYGNGIDEPVEIERIDPVSGELKSYVPLQDTNGNVLGIADADGNLIEKVSYTPYGGATFIYDHEQPKVDGVRIAEENVRIRFSEVVTEQSAKDAIKVKQGASALSGSFAFAEDGRLVIFAPASALPQNELLTISISTELSDKFENKLATAFSQDFTYTGVDIVVYDRVAPEVESIIYENSKFNVEFAEEIDPSSVANSVEIVAGSTTITGSCVLAAEKTITFTPNSSANSGTLRVKAVVKDLSGKTNALFNVDFDLTSGDTLIYERPKENEHSQSYIKNTTLFQGRELDYETGLYYFRHRYFNPELGRFMSPDPKGYVNSMNLYQAFGNNPINFKDPFGFDWAEYTGQKITWYGGKPEDRTKPMQEFPATSGLPIYQKPIFVDKKEGGPIPDGKFKINLKVDPNRIAEVNLKNGDLFWNPKGGIQQIPFKTQLNNGNVAYQPGWGTIRAYLEPYPKNKMFGRFPKDRFYVHNSNKGYTHGCIETSNGFFNRLLKYRLEHPEEFYFQFNVNYIGETTYGGTENAVYPILIFTEPVSINAEVEN